MDKLGIEPQLLLAQVVNFFIVFLVLSKFLYKPILGIIEKRKKEIAQGLSLTEKMRAMGEAQKSKEEKLLAEARLQARNIVESGQKEAEEVKKEIIARAHEEAAGIALKAKADVGALEEQMQKDVSRSAAVLAEAMTKRLIAGVLTTSAQHALIAKELKKLEQAT